MKESESSNASNSDATSTSGQPSESEKAPETPPLSEADYLAKQAADAQAAMAKAWNDLKASIGQSVDVKKWTGRYPWIATGTALAAGLAAGYLLTPRDKDEAAEMWEKLKEKIAGSKGDPNTVYVEPTNGKPAQAVAEQPSVLGTILREGMKSVMPLVTSMLGAAMGGGEAAAKAQEEHPHEGPA